MIKTNLKTERYNEWTNKNTYLYSLAVDSDDRDDSFRKVVKISKMISDIKFKRKELIKVIKKLKVKLDFNKVNFNEIIDTYKKEIPVNTKGKVTIR